MRSSARIATLAVALLLVSLGALATTPRPVLTLDVRYHGTELPPENRIALEQTLRDELHPAHPVRLVVTISDREVGTR